MTLTTEARNAAVDAVVDLLDGGTVEFQTSSNNEVASCAFDTPAFGAADGGTATAEEITDDTDATGGTVDHVVLKKSNNTTLLTLTASVVGGAGDIEMTSLVVGAGDTVKVTSLTITQPAS